MLKKDYFSGPFITFLAIICDYYRQDGHNFPMLLFPLSINLLILINHVYISKNHNTVIKDSIRFFLYSIAIIINVHIVIQGYFDWMIFSLIVSMASVSGWSPDKNTTFEKPHFILRRIEKRFLTWLFGKITWFRNHPSLMGFFYVYLLYEVNILIAPLLTGQPFVVSSLFASVYFGGVYIISNRAYPQLVFPK